MAKKQDQKKKKKEIISVARSPDFKNVSYMGAFGKFTPYDFRMNIYNEILDEGDGKKTYISPIQLIMSPLATKELASWLGKKVKEYEKAFGKIEAIDISKLSEE